MCGFSAKIMKRGAPQCDNAPVIDRRTNFATAKLLRRTWALARAFGQPPAERLLLAAGIDKHKVEIYLSTKTDRRKKTLVR